MMKIEIKSALTDDPSNYDKISQLINSQFHLATIVNDFNDVNVLKGLTNTDEEPKVLLIKNTIQDDDDDSQKLAMNIITIPEFIADYQNTILVTNEQFNNTINAIDNLITNDTNAATAFHSIVLVPEIINEQAKRALIQQTEIKKTMSLLQESIVQALKQTNYIHITNLGYLSNNLTQPLNTYGDDLIVTFEEMVNNLKNEILDKAFAHSTVSAHLKSQPWDMNIEIELGKPKKKWGIV